MKKDKAKKKSRQKIYFNTEKEQYSMQKTFKLSWKNTYNLDSVRACVCVCSCGRLCKMFSKFSLFNNVCHITNNYTCGFSFRQ